MKKESFHGIFTPLITPLTEDEEIDFDSLRRLVDFQIEQGVHGLWAMGTTGEFAAFDEEERETAVQTIVSQAAGRVPVIANVSDAATRLVLRHSGNASKVGADAIAATPPYYYPHVQAELLAHYRAIGRSASLPLFVYNIPQTVRVSISLATVRTLAAEGSVVGIKDSQNNLEWFRELTLSGPGSERRFRAFAGTRHLIDAAVLAGACGAIPSIANAYPALCVQTYEAATAGDFARSSQFQSQIVEIESRIQFDLGSRNGATIASLKRTLKELGVIRWAGVTAPLLAD